MPRAEASVTTMSCLPMHALRDWRACFRACASPPASSSRASSTTRPSSCGKSTAAAGAAKAHNSAIMARSFRIIFVAMPDGKPVPLFLASLLELHLRRALGLFGDGERLHRLVAFVERARPDHAGKRLELGVVGLHRLDVVAPRDRDAVLGAFELRLQREEVLVRFQVRIVFADREQPAERAGKLASAPPGIS